MPKDKSNDELAEDVRSAGSKLADALLLAQEAGLSVVWPQRVEDLRSLSVSETAESQRREQPQPAPPATIGKPAEAPVKGQ